jgi:hypothetical protein
VAVRLDCSAATVKRAIRVSRSYFLARRDDLPMCPALEHVHDAVRTRIPDAHDREWAGRHFDHRLREEFLRWHLDSDQLLDPAYRSAVLVPLGQRAKNACSSPPIRMC